jgi:hypothetical protein
MGVMVQWGLHPQLAWASPVGKSTCIWEEGKGEVVADLMTPQEAKQLALRQARSQAIEKAVGIEVKKGTITRDFTFAGQFIESLAKGRVESEQAPRWEQDQYQKKRNDEPIPIYRVTLKACVRPLATLHDPGFTLTATLNKGTFVSGERARLEIKSSRPVDVMIFNLTADDRVYPYDRQPELGLPLRLKSSEPGSFPPTGVSLEMRLPPGQVRTSEAFIVVATKQTDHMVLPLRIDAEGTLSLTEFHAMLANVESDLVDTFVPYSILGR